MRPTAAPARLIGLDWGTSSLRAWLFDAAGRILAQRQAPQGIQSVAPGRFAHTFASICDGWLGDPALPAIACGMVGSRQGWQEAPYVPAPAGFAALAGGLLRIDAAAGRPFAIVPGVSIERDDGTHDVMRGEETQVFGALGHDSRGDREHAADLVLPGTHSKWVQVRGGRIVAFRTYLTGELYAVLSRHSILGRLFDEGAAGASHAPAAHLPAAHLAVGDLPAGHLPATRLPATDSQRSGPPTTGVAIDPEHAARSAGAFRDGVARAATDPAGLSALLFSVRAEGLFGRYDGASLPEYLSGLLIGAEIAHARRDRAAAAAGGATPAVSVIGDDRLAARYRTALAQLGIAARDTGAAPAAAGLFGIACAAGLIPGERAQAPDRVARHGQGGDDAR